MTQLHREVILPYSAQQMYELVNDVAAYPEFLPWCRSAQILQCSRDEMLASIEVVASGVSKSFTTRNELVPYQKIDMELVNGPFKNFSSIWQFDMIDQEHCRVTLDMSFQFSNRLMAILLEKVFNRAAQKMTDAFSQRANELYG